MLIEHSNGAHAPDRARRAARARLAPFLLLVAALAGCAEIQKIAASAIQRPRLTFEAATLEALDLEGATIGFRYRLENPNAVSLSLARLSYGLEVEGRSVAAGQVKGGLDIPANGTVPVTFPVHFRFADVPAFAKLVASREAVSYRLSGNAGIQTPLGVLDVPLSFSDRMPLPRLPGFTLAGLELRSVSFSDATLEVKLKIENPNRFPLPSGKVSYGLDVAGTEVARTDGRGVGAVLGGETTVVAIPVKLSLAGAGRAMSAVVQGGPVDVALRGEASFGGIPIPLDLHGRLPALR